MLMNCILLLLYLCKVLISYIIKHLCMRVKYNIKPKSFTFYSLGTTTRITSPSECFFSFKISLFSSFRYVNFSVECPITFSFIFESWPEKIMVDRWGISENSNYSQLTVILYICTYISSYLLTLVAYTSYSSL